MNTNRKKHQFIEKVLRFLPFYLFTFLPFNTTAQTFLDRLQQPVAGQGTITVHQDTAINQVILNPQSTLKPEDRRPAETSHNTPTRPSSTGTGTGTSTSTSTTTSTTTSTSRPDTTTTVTTPTTGRTRRVVNGFRIQAFAGGNSREDRKKAERTANAIRSQLPNVPVSAHFYPPRWICYVGSFRTHEEAAQMLRTVKGLGYNQALIVKAKVTVYQ